MTPRAARSSRGARGVGGLTCGLELELQSSDRVDITFKEMNVLLNHKVHNDATRHSASNDQSTIKVFKLRSKPLIVGEAFLNRFQKVG